MEGRGLMSCLILLLSLTFTSASKILHSIQDLKSLDFGHTSQRYGLPLLHWFANNIEINNNDIIPQNFEPNRGDYGIHHYGNYNRHFPSLPAPCRNGGSMGTEITSHYYTLGNLNYHNVHNNAQMLPTYVTHGSYNSRQEGNRDRIIIQVREERGYMGIISRTINQVYLTQHYAQDENQGSDYDPSNTFRISPALLQEIRELPTCPTESYLRYHFGQHFEHSDLNQLSNWGTLTTLGLLLFIVIGVESTQSFKRNLFGCVPSFIPSAAGVGDEVDNVEPLCIKLNVKTSKKKTARMCWDYIPEKLLKQGVIVVLFKNNKETHQITFKSVGNSASGGFDTSTDLNPGLQVRLHKSNSWLKSFYAPVGEEIWRGPEFHDANGEVPTYINGFEEASIQLFVQDGMACARLYVRKTFTDWKVKFNDSWIGFYSTKTQKTSDYSIWKWQWVNKFARENLTDWDGQPDYDVYAYHSSFKIAPGVQARFILKKKTEAIACTPEWKS